MPSGQSDTRPVSLERPSRAAAAVAGDASRASASRGTRAGDPGVDVGRLCTWCGGRVPPRSRSDAIYCGVVCRKRAWRFARAVPRRSPARPTGRVPRGLGIRAARFAYADPPYPGLAGYYVERQEVDHASLLEQLVDGWPDGWALSTSAAALRDVLPLCPRGVRVCVWRRQVRPARSRAPLSAWEPLIVHGGRALQTERVQEVLDVLDYRGRYDSYPGALVGMKPPEFAGWMFSLLGAQAGDELNDLYPGSGAIGRAWTLYTSLGPDVDGDASPKYSEVLRDACRPPAAARDASSLDAPAIRDGSGE